MRHQPLATFLFLLLIAVAVVAEASATGDDACGRFTPRDLPHGAVMTTVELRTAQGVFPAACIVRGTLATSPTSTITWAVELPTRALWNGKALMFGGSGFDGFTPTDVDYYHVMAAPASAAYARMGSDSGHQVRSFFPWANDAVALRNHAFEANHLTLVVGTEVVAQFYGKRPTRRYMLGQSNGGRSALVAAQRYPQDYDGIIAIEPAIAQQAHQINLGARTMQHIYSRPENWLDEQKIALFANAERAACDGLDGLQDGIIANIAACTYIPTDLQCAEGQSDDCLTAGQIESIRLIYSDHAVPVTLGDGTVGYPRFGRGGAATSDWREYFFGTSFGARDAFNYIAATEAARVVERNEQAAAFPHDATRFAAEYLALSSLMDPTDPDLSAFSERGGKLLLWYGTADSCVSIFKTAQYFEAVKLRMGAQVVTRFARFLVTPGVGHDMSGPGPSAIDLVSAMDDWVERGKAPEALTVAKLDAQTSAVVFERPACEFPTFARYDGVGEPTKAASFRCSER